MGVSLAVACKLRQKKLQVTLLEMHSIFALQKLKITVISLISSHIAHALRMTVTPMPCEWQLARNNKAGKCLNR